MRKDGRDLGIYKENGKYYMDLEQCNLFGSKDEILEDDGGHYEDLVNEILGETDFNFDKVVKVISIKETVDNRHKDKFDVVYKVKLTLDVVYKSSDELEKENKLGNDIKIKMREIKYRIEDLDIEISNNNDDIENFCFLSYSKEEGKEKIKQMYLTKQKLKKQLLATEKKFKVQGRRYIKGNIKGYKTRGPEFNEKFNYGNKKLKEGDNEKGGN